MGLRMGPRMDPEESPQRYTEVGTGGDFSQEPAVALRGYGGHEDAKGRKGSPADSKQSGGWSGADSR